MFVTGEWRYMSITSQVFLLSTRKFDNQIFSKIQIITDPIQTNILYS